jgi:hypothetical protein
MQVCEENSKDRSGRGREREFASAQSVEKMRQFVVFQEAQSLGDFC